MIKLIIFDVWKTLAYRNTKLRSTSMMRERFNSKIPKKEFIKIFENSVQTKKWDSKYEMYRNLAINIGLEDTKDNVDAIMEIRNHCESQTTIYDYTIPLLKAVKKAGYETALLSNTSNYAFEKIKNHEFMKYIDYPVCSFMVGSVKPDRRNYEYVLKESGYEAKEALMIGDNMEDDVIAPTRVGINAVHFIDIDKLIEDLKKFDIYLEFDY